MKKFLCALVLVALTVPAVMAQLSKVDLRGQDIYENYKEKVSALRQGKALPAHLKSVNIPDKMAVTIRMNSEADIDKIEAAGAEVVSQAGNMAVVNINVADLERLSLVKEVQAIQSARRAKLVNDNGRDASRVTDVRNGLKDKSGNTISTYFDGTGVVVGLMDTGLDPNHINFMDSDGNTRVKGITKYSYVGGSARATNYTTADAIANFTTEEASETHGSHVLGIITGAYADEKHDYSGMAPGADIWVCCGNLEDPCIEAAVDKIAGYADQQGKPAVINMSLGINSGSHDQFDSFNQYIDNIVTKYTNQPIICISSGNEGSDKIALKRTFTASNTSFSTIVPIYDFYYNSYYGYDIEFYGNDGTSFSVTPFIYEYSSKKSVLELSKIKVTGPISGTVTLNSSSDSNFANYGSGYIRVTAKVNPQSGRFYAAYHGTFEASTSGYRLGFKVEGSNGQTIYSYATDNDGILEFTNGGSPANISGSGDGTINSMCCGLHTLSIGSYNTRNQWTSTSGSTYSSGYSVGRISSFSSWGNVWDGRLLPHVCAPGSMIISSVSTYNVNYSGSDASYYRFPSTDIVYKVTGSSRDYHWGVMQGTSMSSPHAAGVFALWKQLKPDLTPAQCVETAQATAKTDSYTTSAGGQAGAGKLDAYAGMQYILENYSGVESLLARDLPTVLVRETSRNEFTIAAAEGDAFTATLFNVSGKVAASACGKGNATLSAAGLAKGVYVLKVNGAKVNHSQKLVVR